MNKKYVIILVLIILFTFSFSSCRKNKTQSVSEKASQQSSSQQSSSQQSSSQQSSSQQSSSQQSSSQQSSSQQSSSQQSSSTGEPSGEVETEIEISSKEQLLNFMSLAESNGTYYLSADIDLAGEVLESPNIIFSGTFDGKGHKIKNATLINAEAKVGILSAKTIDGGTFKNIQFINCTISSTNETCAIVTGLAEEANFENIEFNRCSSQTTNNYCGLVYGRNTAVATNYIKGITVKNNSYTSCKQYGGLIIGDNKEGSTINISDLDIKGELKDSSGNGSLIGGRVRQGAFINIKNAVIDGTVPNTGFGLFACGSKAATLTLENVYIKNTNSISPVIGKGKMTSITAKNCFYSESVNLESQDGFAAVELSQATREWLKTTLKLDFVNTWMNEGESGYRLKSASTNIVSPGAILTSISLNTQNATTRFMLNEDFSYTGLSVTATYSDGVQLLVNDFNVDSSSFNKTVASESYEIKVSLNGKEASYNVKVVSLTDFKLYDEFVKKTYILDDELNIDNLVVKTVWSDGVEEVISKEDYSIGTEFNNTLVGEYEISITYGEFEPKKVKVLVIDGKDTPEANTIKLKVDQNSTSLDGTIVDDLRVFKSLTSAVDYLSSCNYDANITKIIYIANGRYEEKVTIPESLANLKLVGESRDNTVLTYSAVESTINILTGSQYGLSCGSLIVNSTGFGAINLSIRNDFDFVNEAKNYANPQGLALTINGDMATLTNVHLYGNQDTLYLKSGRSYFDECLIEGNIDFIFGEATGLAYFNRCEIKAITRDNANAKNNGYVTAAKHLKETQVDYGYIFNECNLTNGENVADGSMSLGRPWGDGATVTYINCSFSKAYSVLAYDGTAKSRWYDMSVKPDKVFFSEYGSKGEGAITTAVNGGQVLTEEQAKNYTKENLFATTNGEVTWAVNWDSDESLTKLKELSTE